MADQVTMLVIGAGGFIGSHLREAATAAGTRVIGASRSAGADAAGDVFCDLSDPDSLRRLVATTHPDEIVNAAGPPSVAESWRDPIATAHLHTLGTVNLLEAARLEAPEAHLTCLSSAEVYGSSAEPRGEDDPLLPITPYGAAKAAMETFCDHHRRVYGQPIAVIRPFNQIGPGMPPGNAVADFVHTVAVAEAADAGAHGSQLGEGITGAKTAGGAGVVRIPVANPGAVRDFTDVRDCAAMLLEVARRRLDGTYNLCSGRGTDIAGLLDLLSEVAGVEIEVELDRDLARPADPSVKVGRPERLAEATGLRATTPLRQTLADMLTAARGGTK